MALNKLSFSIDLQKYFELSSRPAKDERNIQVVSRVMGFDADQATCDERTIEFISAIQQGRKALLDGKVGPYRMTLGKFDSIKYAAHDNLANIHLMCQLGIVPVKNFLGEFEAKTQINSIANGNLRAVPADHLKSVDWTYSSYFVKEEAAKLYIGLGLPNTSLVVTENLLAKRERVDVSLIRAAALAIFYTSPSVYQEDVLAIMGKGEIQQPRREAISGILQRGGMAPEFARDVLGL